MTKSSAFTDNKLNVVKVMISVFDRVENIVERGENASYNSVFQSFFFGVIKTGKLNNVEL